MIGPMKGVRTLDDNVDCLLENWMLSVDLILALVSSADGPVLGVGKTPFMSFNV